jgi:hypothetical protein
MATLGPKVVAVALAFGGFGIGTLADATQAHGSPACDAVAERGDAATTFISSLTPGQTGCLRGGTYSFTSEQLKMRRPDVTVTSYPGERATLVGRIWVARGADGVKISNLDLDGRNAENLASPTVSATGTVWRNLDVTNGHARSSCFLLGPIGWGKARRTKILSSRIHNCGELPPTNHHHGIYVVHSRGGVVRNNWIYDNADRGVQFYPNARRTRVIRNVIDGNGEGVLFSGDSRYASSENVVKRNIISNSKVRYNVEAYWPGGVGTRNRLRRNCLHASNPRSSHFNEDGGIARRIGFTARRNRVADPGYLDPTANDFRLQPLSRCQGYGPGTGG